MSHIILSLPVNDKMCPIHDNGLAATLRLGRFKDFKLSLVFNHSLWVTKVNIKWKSFRLSNGSAVFKDTWTTSSSASSPSKATRSPLRMQAFIPISLSLITCSLLRALRGENTRTAVVLELFSMKSMIGGIRWFAASSWQNSHDISFLKCDVSDNFPLFIFQNEISLSQNVQTVISIFWKFFFVKHAHFNRKSAIFGLQIGSFQSRSFPDRWSRERRLWERDW